MRREDPDFQKGRQIRSEMFGPVGIGHLDNADDFQAPLQDLVTRVCFGEVWGREGVLTRAERSMLTIALMVGQSRPEQFKRHIRGAIRNGVTKEQIREVLFHATLYAGIPAGTDSWDLATQALKEVDAY